VWSALAWTGRSISCVEAWVEGRPGGGGRDGPGERRGVDAGWSVAATGALLLLLLLGRGRKFLSWILDRCENAIERRLHADHLALHDEELALEARDPSGGGWIRQLDPHHQVVSDSLDRIVGHTWILLFRLFEHALRPAELAAAARALDGSGTTELDGRECAGRLMARK
jgi:hypothetical protein